MYFSFERIHSDVYIYKMPHHSDSYLDNPKLMPTVAIQGQRRHQIPVPHNEKVPGNAAMRRHMPRHFLR